MRTAYDVIIVGAGAAGISSAHYLYSKGVDFHLIEAKSRIGGRVMGHFDQKLRIPVELGAEFVHGAPKYTIGWLSRLDLPFYDVQDHHAILNQKRLVQTSNFIDRMGEFTEKLDLHKKRDRPVAEFLVAHRKFKPYMQPYFRAFVEGFHAADLKIIGEHELAAAAETDDDNLNGTTMFRCGFPYQELLRGILRTFATDEILRTETILRKISWSRNMVRLTVAEGPSQDIKEIRCRKLILTLPVGVLKSDTIEWVPFPTPLARFLQYAHMGHVQRITFHFRERFWEDLSDKPVSFMHLGSEDFFTTWWSLQPLRTPVLVAWQGGPKAEELSRKNPEERIQYALYSLAKLTQKSIHFVRKQLVNHHSHDWSNDLYAKGAYSYLSVDGLGKECRSIEDTIFIAGEAVAMGPERGTVHGALNSGVRAAQSVNRSLNKLEETPNTERPSRGKEQEKSVRF